MDTDTRLKTVCHFLFFVADTPFAILIRHFVYFSLTKYLFCSTRRSLDLLLCVFVQDFLGPRFSYEAITMDYDGLFHLSLFILLDLLLIRELRHSGCNGREGRGALGTMCFRYVPWVDGRWDFWGLTRLRAVDINPSLHIHASGFRRGLSGSFCEPLSQGVCFAVQILDEMYGQGMGGEVMIGIGGK